MTEEKDWMDEAGANELARRIRRFWNERGFAPDVRVESASMPMAKTKKGEIEVHRSRIYVVRSNITEKLPPRMTRVA